ALAVGCGGDDAQPSSLGTTTAQVATAQAKKGGTLRTAVTSYPSSFDPQDVGSSGIRTILASRLITAKTGPGIADLSSQVAPDVAESWEWPDATTLFVKLRSNAKFGPPISRPMTTEQNIFC